MSSELNSPIPVHFSLLIPSMSTFTLAISCLTTSNLPWFMDLRFQVPMQFALYSIGPCFYHQSRPQLGIVFSWLHPVTLSGVISPLICSSILGTYRPGEFLFQCPIFLPSHIVHGVLKNAEVVCQSLLRWTTSCQTYPPWPDRLGWSHTAWLSFTELDKAVVLWSDWLDFCHCGFGVSALWCPLTAPPVLPGLLLPWTWGISSRLLQQSAAAAPYLGRGGCVGTGGREELLHVQATYYLSLSPRTEDALKSR